MTQFLTSWTPPPRTTVLFRFGALRHVVYHGEIPADSLSSSEFDRLVGDFHRKFDLSDKEYGHTKLAIADPRWPAMLDEIDRLTESKLIGLRGSGAVWLEEPAPSARNENAWFKLATGPRTFRSPGRVREGDHFLDGEHMTVASQSFVDAVTSSRLTGLRFLPLETTTPADPSVWHQVFATQPLGRGLDHPLIDPAKLDRNRPSRRGMQPRSLHCGDPVARLRAIRDGVRYESDVFTKLVSYGHETIFRVVGHPRFVREFLPDTDFAYFGWPWNGDEINVLGKRARPYSGRAIRGIYCNTRARSALIEAGLMKPARFSAITTVPRAEAFAEILDDIPEPLPPPTFTPEEAEAERVRREAIVLNRQTNPSLAFASNDEALAYFQRRRESGESSWPPASDHEYFDSICRSKLFKKTPISWQHLLPELPAIIQYTNEAQDEVFEFEIAEPEWNDWLIGEPPEDEDDGPSDKDLVIGRTPCGDWFSIRTTDPGLPHDARVTYWDHETSTPHDEWPTVRAFAAHLALMADKAASK